MNDRREQARASLARHEDAFIRRLAASTAVDPSKVAPRLVPIVDRASHDGLLWRWAALHWAIPVSAGYGRRLRWLALDEACDDALIGIIGLADPVFAVRARDDWVGWSAADRKDRLAWVMDAFALGAVPPYASLLGGKLIASLAASTEVRQAFASKYAHKNTRIRDRDPGARLALLTTTSALGRSSVYNRLGRPDGSLAWESLGYTLGTGDFHLSGPLYEELAAFAASITPGGSTQRHASWGGGQAFRNRREVLQRALAGLGLDSRKLRVHGVQREVFAARLADNALPLLRGEHRKARWRTLPVEDTAEYWRRRWAIPRAERLGVAPFDPISWRLWT